MVLRHGRPLADPDPEDCGRRVHGIDQAHQGLRTEEGKPPLLARREPGRLGQRPVLRVHGRPLDETHREGGSAEGATPSDRDGRRRELPELCHAGGVLQPRRGLRPGPRVPKGRPGHLPLHHRLPVLQGLLGAAPPGPRDEHDLECRHGPVPLRPRLRVHLPALHRLRHAPLRQRRQRVRDPGAVPEQLLPLPPRRLRLGGHEGDR
mmetsp:Transcript_55026/g.161791  ORF Transcript_55026/g.161791 Transcript_55026/m.161791 type:complete len:206 (-) Transcript_55026:828-1445(-)